MAIHPEGVAEETRCDIIHSIHDLGKKGQPAVDYLLLALKDEDKRVRIAAANALCDVGDARCVDALIILLSDGDKDIRFVAASLLGKIGDPRAREPLSRACADENCFVRIMAKEALHRIR
ncbi:MAG: HEAT repeat domain-containing protein [Methanolinea sp.]|nr:HEAT repeat domain-containing protein [Methanolinea sp.]